jgi:hypothetical protein
MGLDVLVAQFAQAIAVVDSWCEPFVSRTGRRYQAGIGPYSENQAMALVVEELCRAGLRGGQFLPYPAASRQKCDLWIGEPLDWVIEVKMGRFRGDDGKPDDTGIKDLISPFSSDRSALGDGVKLAASTFPCRKAVLVYGFDDAERPLEKALDALDLLLRARVAVSQRQESTFQGLRHPVFSSGRVAGWEITGPRESPGRA